MEIYVKRWSTAAVSTKYVYNNCLQSPKISKSLEKYTLMNITGKTVCIDSMSSFLMCILKN